MFAICKQNHSATGVEFSITCNFFNNYERNIVTAGANIIKVYRVIPNIDFNTVEKEKYTDQRPPRMLLECLASYQLFGNVMALQSVSLAGSQRDALLVSFRDAKLSVVQHDPDTFELKTLSLHFFEDDDIRCGWTGNYHIPIVRVDPDNRCAVMLVYGRSLVVLPFRRDNTLDEIELQDVKPMKKTHTQFVAKTPILASYIISLKDMDEKIDNVIDVQFLHGYYEPTLLILFEPVRTFPGRIAVRTDTCTMVAISLNIQQRVHPIIWTVSSLPYDCTQIIPIKKPISGCLIVSINALIYLNQSVPPYGVSLNSVADHSTNFPLKPQDGIKLSLDAAQITFIEADKLVMSLKGGELYVLTLCADSMRNIRNFHFSKAASSVLTSCITLFNEEYLFLGSRLGNSLLLRFTEKDQNTVITIHDDGDPLDKDTLLPRKRLEEEELEVYGSGDRTMSVQLTSYTFEVSDSVLNIAPIGYMAIGERDNEDAEAAGDNKAKPPNSYECDLEIVTASGHGKNGSICVLQNSIKPQIITSFGLSGFIDLWTVYDDSLQQDDASNPHHKFMILSQPKSTMVLQTGEEINEIENTGFANNQSTIFVGNLGNNRYIAQILSNSIRLLQGTRLIQNIQIDIDSPFVMVSICDPYVCIKTESGQVITLALREIKNTPRLAVNKNTISNSPNVTALCAYKDFSGMFTQRFEDYADRSGGGAGGGVGSSANGIYSQHSNAFNSGFGYMKREPNMKIEDEEDLLYGETGNSFKVTSLVELAIPSKNINTEWWRRLIQPPKSTFWLFVVRDNGNLEIYTMPDMKLVYLVTNIGNGNNVLVDSMEFVQMTPGQYPADASMHTADSMGQNYNQSNFNRLAVPKELLMVGLGANQSRPLLFLRTATEILIYRVFRYPKGHLKIRFRKMAHDIMLPQLWAKRGAASSGTATVNTPNPQGDTLDGFPELNVPPLGGNSNSYSNEFGVGENRSTNQNDTDPFNNSMDVDSITENVVMMKYLQNISGHNGIIISGERPYFILLTVRGELRVHRFYGNTAMNNFASFNNVNCPSGMLYFDYTNELQIAMFPSYLTYDEQWPIRKVPLKCTPMFIVYHKESKVYCLVTSTDDITTKYYRFNGEDKELTEENKGERFLYPTILKYTIVLIAPNTLEEVPDVSIDLEPWEHVTAFKNVHLSYEGTLSGLKEYICIGTNYNFSEDITSRGRILIYDIIQVVPEPGKPLTRFKFKEVYIKDQKGPVSAITHVLGFLVTAVGQKIYLWQLKDDDLIGVAFIDTNIYVHQMISIKSIILVADVYKSISLLRFQEDFRTLSLVSRDYQPLSVLNVEFMVDNTNLCFITSDCSENILIYMYQPESRESFGGQKLLRKSDYHVGQKINAMFRVQCNHRTISDRLQNSYETRHITFFSTLDGGIGYCLPLPERTYRRLLMLQNVLITQIEHLCGLNPKAYRTIKSGRKLQSNPSRCIVDGELIWSFLALPYNEKLDVAKKIGTRVEEIFADLIEIDGVSSIF